MFSSADRRLIQDIKDDIAAIDDKLDINGLLVEIRALLKILLGRVGGMTPEQEAEVTAALKQAKDRLAGLGKES